ncbi:MAG: N-acetyltransferase [Phycisphaerae bacterium]|nr:N-acetyltransferase [Phycisphaerae bacterium]
MTLKPFIRDEQPGDIEAIAQITELAFRTLAISRHTEPFIIRDLRRSGALSISLVAELDGRVVGHIAFSPATISDGSQNWYMLGPISVVPDLQRKGIGSALIHAGLDRIRGLKAKGCALVGDPAYYRRFGFRSDPRCTMDGVPQKVVQILPFGKRVPNGNLIHHEAFNARA